MRISVLLLIALLLTGCQEVVDISALPDRYQALFRIAAERQGVGTDNSSTYPWEWRADIGSLPPGTRGRAIEAEGTGLYCRIRIDVSKRTPCPISFWPRVVFDNGELSFINPARHEIGHCQGKKHSNDPSSYMHKAAPCYPSD